MGPLSMRLGTLGDVSISTTSHKAAWPTITPRFEGTSLAAEQLLHGVDPVRLSGFDALGELDRIRVHAVLLLCLSHLDRALVVLDHHLQPPLFEAGAPRLLELFDALGGQHPGDLLAHVPV